MGIAIAAERRLLAEDEYEPVAASHYPALETAKRADLIELAGWLRERRAKASDIVRDRRRVRRGKAEPRGVAAEAPSELGQSAKKQVFARALRRVNARLERLAIEERRGRGSAHLAGTVERKAKMASPPPKPAPKTAKADTPKAETPKAETPKATAAKETAKPAKAVEAGKAARAAPAAKKASAKDAKPE
ncbi:hypothetical protein [Phreatobacter stygius]|uniref:Uncharacterized protein n=1 Tax=Phreatobacter stygius TaxID=1940610 RepID=A0A4D7B6Y1_9HYPH|nr:hypothetical protein [Phreatobacter stygius]QCI66795.1 hypothetical protein E8M01_22665 [Phreatobacter stygius]